MVSYNDFISSNPVQLNMTKIKRKKYSRQLFAPNLNNNAKKALEKIQGFNGILFGGLGQSFSLRDACKQVPRGQPQHEDKRWHKLRITEYSVIYLLILYFVLNSLFLRLGKGRDFQQKSFENESQLQATENGTRHTTPLFTPMLISKSWGNIYPPTLSLSQHKH